MGAPLKSSRQRTAYAVLASGVVISLTALTGGVAPASAKPGNDPAAPTTTVVPEPTVEVAPQAPREDTEKPPAEKSPAEKPTVADVPSAVAPPPVTAAPSVPETVEAPPRTREPQPAPAVDSPSAVESAPSSAPAVTSAPPVPATSTTTTATTTVATTAASSAPTASVTSTPREGTGSGSTDSVPTDAPGPRSVTPGPPQEVPGQIAPSAEATPSGPSGSAATSATSATSAAVEGSESSAQNSTSSATTSATQQLIQKVAPQTLQAPAEDVEIAKAAKVVEVTPAEAPKQEIDDISRVVELPNQDRAPRDKDSKRDEGPVRLAGNWDRNVRQWRPDWIQYDEYYRPVLSNPYRDPVRIVYVYQNAPRVVWIPPLARIVLEAAQFAAYSFTAVVTNPINQAVDVAVGSFFGGGYFPGVGQPLPPPPPRLLNYANVPVQVRYSDATYQPFRVSKIVDVGDDPRYGERKVLLDGVTPAWGQWKQTPSGERSFEVHKTQQFPGLDDPQEAPLPGDYQMTLASDESSSGMNKRDVYLIAVAVACGALSIGAVVLSVFIGRRRRPGH